jgi:hypothetical protein
MNLKVKLFKIACYINLFSILLIFGMFFYDKVPLEPSKNTFDDIIGFILLFLIISVYAGNFYYGIKLIIRCNKELPPITINNKIRITFFGLEIVLAILYSILIYFTIEKFKFRAFLPFHIRDFSRVIAVLSIFCGYFSSLTRLFLTNSLLRIISLQDKSVIERIGLDKAETS